MCDTLHIQRAVGITPLHASSEKKSQHRLGKRFGACINTRTFHFAISSPQLLSQQTAVGIQFRLAIQDFFTRPSNNRKAIVCLLATGENIVELDLSLQQHFLEVFISMLNLSLKKFETHE